MRKATVSLLLAHETLRLGANSQALKQIIRGIMALSVKFDSIIV